jgi:hypothetical protein
MTLVLCGELKDAFMPDFVCNSSNIQAFVDPRIKMFATAMFQFSLR